MTLWSPGTALACLPIPLGAADAGWKPVPRYGFVVERMAQSAGLRTGEVARRAGVNVQTLRYYERRGAHRRAQPQQRLSDLIAIRDTLRQVLAAGCDSLTACTCPDCPLPTDAVS